MIPPDARLAKAISARVKTLRIEHGMTASTLAELVDSHRPIICRIESGQHVPTVQTLSRIAHAFGLDLAGFFADMDTTPAAAVMHLGRSA